MGILIRGKAFSLSPLGMMLAVGLSHMVCGRLAFFDATQFVERIIKDVAFSQMLSVSTEMIILSSVLSIWHISLISPYVEPYPQNHVPQF